MSESKKSPSMARFGAFTVNLGSGELRNNGRPIRLQAQPFQILEAFLERPNELITREELQRRVWPADTFVDFDQGLNKAINKLRDALCDTAETPRFIETVPKRGYRFIAPVVIEPQPVPATAIPETSPVHISEPDVQPIKRSALIVRLALFGIAGVALAAILIAAWEQRSVESDDLHSVAVLPLLAQSDKADYDLADGTTDSIINDLSLVPNLRVISHASVFQYRDRVVEPRTIGQKLGVGAVLTGRLEEAGTTLTVNLELTATSDGRHLWGQQYTRNIAERAGLALEVADAVSDALRLNLTPAKRHDIGSQDTSNAEAHQLYLKGRYYFFKETPDDVLRARRLFQEAIDRDPTYALAYSALGDTYDWMATEGDQPLSEVLSQATAAKTKANELNSSSAEIHTSLGGLELVRGNWAKAETEFQKALAINPNYFEAHRLYSIYLRTMRRFPEAIEHAKLCNELNPLLLPAESHLALTYYYARQYEAAAEQYRLLLKDDPERPGAHAGLSAVLLKMGKEKEAIEEWQKALILSGNEVAAQKLGRTYAQSGFRAAQEVRLRGELQSLTQIAEQNYVSPTEFAYRYALLNDKEAAFRWLEKAYLERSPQLFNLNVDPDYDNLRDDARFADLLSRLHLPQ
jgi:DNA-binding winged helix-turn-helix (wHTH) protein/TolB-like protein/lipoprotein NlpI